MFSGEMSSKRRHLTAYQAAEEAACTAGVDLPVVVQRVPGHVTATADLTPKRKLCQERRGG